MSNKNTQGLRFERSWEWKSLDDQRQQKSSKRCSLKIEKRKGSHRWSFREGNIKEFWRKRELQRITEKRREEIGSGDEPARIWDQCRQY
uniref:Uncharacterized protein n=1 Tax=Cucumis melo TaxID=3656 RepID=A0A9I9CDR4_CUCME